MYVLCSKGALLLLCILNTCCPFMLGVLLHMYGHHRHRGPRVVATVRRYQAMLRRHRPFPTLCPFSGTSIHSPPQHVGGFFSIDWFATHSGMRNTTGWSISSSSSVLLLYRYCSAYIHTSCLPAFVVSDEFRPSARNYRVVRFQRLSPTRCTYVYVYAYVHASSRIKKIPLSLPAFLMPVM